MAISLPSPEIAGAANLVSTSFAEIGSADGASNQPVLAPSGRFVAFASNASDLVPGGGSGQSDIYVRDLASGSTVLASVNEEPYLGIASNPTISADGRFVAYRRSMSLNPFTSEIFLRDLAMGTTTLITSDSNGMPVGGSQAILCANGRWLAFLTGSGAFDPRDTNGTGDVYVYEVESGNYRLASVNRFGTASGAGFSENPVLSADGRIVVFQSTAEDLVSLDGNGLTDVFVRDMAGGVTRLVSRSLLGGGGNRPSDSASVSADGRFVLFNTEATDLASHDVNDDFDAYRFSVETGKVELVSVDSGNARSANCSTGGGALSPNGELVLLWSCSSDLVDTVLVSVRDSNVYVRDMSTGTTELVSVNASGTGAADDSSFMPCVSSSCAGGVGFSADGRYVVFSSWAKDLSTDPVVDVCEGAPCLQVFVRDRVAGTTRLLSAGADGLSSGTRPASSPMISLDGAVMTFASEAENLVEEDSNGESDVFVDGLPLAVTAVDVPAAGAHGLLVLITALAVLAAHQLARSGAGF